jgi:hypothetical protein
MMRNRKFGVTVLVTLAGLAVVLLGKQISAQQRVPLMRVAPIGMGGQGVPLAQNGGVDPTKPDAVGPPVPISASGNRYEQLLGTALADNKSDEDIIKMLFQETLHRLPTAAEIKPIVAYVHRVQERQSAFEDLLFALTTSKEFAAAELARKKQAPPACPAPDPTPVVAE